MTIKKLIFITSSSNSKTGVGKYVKILKNSLRKDYSIEVRRPFFLASYPILIKKHKKRDIIVHITNQQLSFPLYFTKHKNVVVTVHDLIPLQYPLIKKAKHIRFKYIDEWFFRKTIQAMKMSKKIICVSEATKKKLLSFIKYPEEDVHVVYEYPSEEFIYKKKKRNPYDILYVGSELPYKNLNTLLKSIKIVKKKIRSIRLIKIGKPQWPGAQHELQEQAKRLGISENIIWKDEVEDLVAEYNSATLFVHPSLHEGFGFPVVEAMACGCPVLSSNRGSLPELGGKAVEFFNPTDEYELAEKIISIIQNKKKQQTMRKKGLKQVKLFNKERFKRETMQVYDLLSKRDI